ncbi:cell envelope integrity protein CreD [candidate division KSB1 bacterium]
MTDKLTGLEQNVNMFFQSTGMKLGIIIVLTLASIIPSIMIENLINERQDRKQEVINEIGSKWSHEQTVTGPIVSIPFRQYSVDNTGTKTYSTEYMHFLPDQLVIKSEVFPEIRYRSIYEAILYNSRIAIKGDFTSFSTEAINTSNAEILWNRAIISLGITDMLGVVEIVDAKFDDIALSMEPGIAASQTFSSGISSNIPVDDMEKEYNFEFIVRLRGSHQISFIPVGKETNVTMDSNWPVPSFDGAFLPVERSIDTDGFTANWKVLNFNRAYPQNWTGDNYFSEVDNSSFGVKFLAAVDIYQQSMRTVKYSFIFVALTFLAFFFSEIMSKTRVHLIQYLFIGMGIILFYLLLLSISEHINFDISYLISSVSVAALITGYAKSILRKKSLSFMVGSVLVILYIFFYILLQLEDYALLFGSAGLFIVLCVIMYTTRNLDWYSINKGNVT